jgi:hypothetical protein
MRYSTFKFLQHLKKLSIDELKADDYLINMDSMALIANCFNSIKFLDFYIRDKVGLNLKTNQSIIRLEKP